MNTQRVNSASEAETRQVGADIAMALQPGDIVGLSGKLGSGKTVLARAIIRNLVGDPDFEVPSPTYTLCQNYDANLPVSHFDLYRINDAAELDELGLDDALEEGCALIEWPEMAFDPFPAHALLISICDNEGDNRTLEISGSGPLFERISHSLLVREFLVQNDFDGAIRSRFSADASARNYELINHQGEILYLMDAPAQPDGPPVRDGKPYSQIAHLAEDVSAFVAVGNALREKGFVAPRIYASDLHKGLLLLENLGNVGIIDDARKPIETRYIAAIEFLAKLHDCSWKPSLEVEPGRYHQIPRYDPGAMLAEVALLIDWYVPATLKSQASKAQIQQFFSIWQGYAERLQLHEQSLVLRDFHSPNILWRQKSSGINKIGVIDYQDALIGSTAYDVASLAQDGRVDVEAALEQRLVEHYITVRKSNRAEFDEDQFRESYALMAAQRATKILGIFVRLDVRDAKPEYLAHLPRIRDYLKRCLKHPALMEYKTWLETVTEL